MSIFGLSLIAALALQAAPPQTGTGMIHGRVLRAGGTEPIEGAAISLITGTGAAPGAGQRGGGAQAPNRLAVSDREGNFEFRDLPPGRYTAVAQRQGFSGPSINSPSPVASVAVANGQAVQAEIFMTPTGVIRGRVRDASGQFASNVPVEALVVTYRNGLPRLMPAVSKTSDDRGEYRLYGIPPGDYYIGATPRPPSAIAAMAGGNRSVKTFHPGAVEIFNATRITIHGGEDIGNIDIGIQTPQTFKVAGTVSTAVAAAPAPPTAQGVFAVIAQNQNNTVNLLLVSRDLTRPDEERSGISVPLTSTGPFELPNVLPGSYDLLALFGDAAGVPSIARTVVDIRNQDVTGLALTIRAGVQVKGVVTVDGNGPRQNAGRVALVPGDTLRRMGVDIPASIDAEGGFTIDGVPDGRWKVVASPGPNFYVEDVLQGGASIYDAGFEIRGRSPDPVQVLVKSGAASLEGTVQDAAGKPVIGGAVVLVPATRRENQALYFSANADSAGSFAIRGITPGDYKLFSWDVMPPGAHYNAAFLEKYEERGIPVTFAASAKLSSKVTTIPR